METVRARARSRRRLLIRTIAVETLYYALMFSLVVAFAMPLVWMLSTSLKPESEVVRLPPKWIPNPFLWSNYPEMWRSSPFGAFYRNSTKIATFNVCGVLFFSSLAGYAFARIEFVGRDILFSILLSTMMIPGAVTLIPLYITFRNIGWIDTHYPLWVPGVLASVSSIFILRQFFMTIPRELEDAARIDGCTNFGVYWKIVIPQVKPALATVGIFTFLGSWNSFIAPLIFIKLSGEADAAYGAGALPDRVLHQCLPDHGRGQCGHSSGLAHIFLRPRLFRPGHYAHRHQRLNRVRGGPTALRRLPGHAFAHHSVGTCPFPHRL